MERNSSSPDVLPEFRAASESKGPPLLALKQLFDMEMSVEVPLGTVDTDLRGLLSLAVGSILRTDRQTGESLEITVNGTRIARGEVRVHGEWFAVRVTEILRASQDRDAEGATPNVQAPSPRA